MLKLSNVLVVLGLAWCGLSYAKTSLFIETKREGGNGYSVRKLVVSSKASSQGQVELSGLRVPGFFQADLTTYLDKVQDKKEVELEVDFEVMKYFPSGGSTSHSLTKKITVKADESNYYDFKLAMEETGWTNYGQRRIPVVSEKESFEVHASPAVFEGKSVDVLQLRPYSVYADPYWFD